MLVDNELDKLNSVIFNSVKDRDNNISEDLGTYLCAKSKRLRPTLIFLFAKALNIKISDEIYKIASAAELVHNATLIHDDIIDNAQLRRGNISLNYQLGNNLSVLAGDVLLSSAMQLLTKCNDVRIVEVFAKCLYNMCMGEINQHFTINKIPSFGEYIKKSERKTADLFKASLSSLCYLKNLSCLNLILDFAYNFGIAFQIKDDLMDILSIDNSKPVQNDIYNGIYTAPVLFLNEDKKIDELSKEKIKELSIENKYVQKTVELIKEYAQKAITAISFIEDNEYKIEIVRLTENLYKAGLNE